MFDVFGKYKNVVIGIIAVAVIILIIYFVGKHNGKVKAEGPKADYPEGGDAIPKGWKPDPLVQELFNVMDGIFTLGITKDETFRKYLSLPTDDMFAAVYNVFNQKYFNKGDGTLREWINDESHAFPFDTTNRMLNERFEKLNMV
jgi:hypothetical protein